MGNIFEDDVTLFSEPGPCLRQDKCCSCALHFINNIIPGVDDSKAHYRMLKGYVPSIEKTYKKWVEERKIETVFHQGTPQGTEVGETLLVIEPPKLPINSGLETPPFESGQIHPLPDFSEWIVEQHSVATSMASEGKFYISTLETKYETLTHSPVFYLETGRHVIRYRTQLKTGGIIVGIQDTNERWLTSNNHMASKTGYLSFENDSLLPKGFYITVSSWNAHGGITQLTLSNLSCRTYSKLLAPLRAISFLAERILRFPQALFRKL